MKPFAIIHPTKNIQKYKNIDISHQQTIKLEPILTRIYQPTAIYKKQVLYWQFIGQGQGKHRRRSESLQYHVVSKRGKQKQINSLQTIKDNKNDVNNSSKISQIDKNQQYKQTPQKKQVQPHFGQQFIIKRTNNSFSIPHRIPIFNKKHLSASKISNKQQKISNKYKILIQQDQVFKNQKKIIEQKKQNIELVQSQIMEQSQKQNQNKLKYLQKIQQSISNSNKKHIPIFQHHSSPPTKNKHSLQNIQIQQQNMIKSKTNQNYLPRYNQQQIMLQMVKLQSLKYNNNIKQQIVFHKIPIFSKNNKIYHDKAFQIMGNQSENIQKDRKFVDGIQQKMQQKQMLGKGKANFNILQIQSGVHEIKVQSDLAKTRKKSQQQSLKSSKKIQIKNIDTHKRQPQYLYKFNQQINHSQRMQKSSQINQFDQSQKIRQQIFLQQSSISLKSNISYRLPKQKYTSSNEKNYSSFQIHRKPIKLSPKVQSPNKTFKKIIGIGKNKKSSNSNSSKRQQKIKIYQQTQIQPFNIKNQQINCYTIPKALKLKPKGVKKSEQSEKIGNIQQISSEKSFTISIKIFSIAQMKPLYI